MPSALPEPQPVAIRPRHRLILCFDGTGNDYQARPNDTNIVKLLEMFDRSSPNQMHYYQPGIGTYTADSSVNQSYLGAMKSNISKTIDTGLGTSFDHHVMAGYRFLMRYHMEGDRIYIFGFSRGAFTARFLSRMIAHVGLLSMGNEEMVPFAFKLYQDYEMNSKKWGNYMIRFRKAFCRHSSKTDKALDASGGFKVHFLGLFDTVSSVGTLERGTIQPPEVLGTSRYVRHAVAIDERRVKFKAALLAQDLQAEDLQAEDLQAQDLPNEVLENCKEVWFPGNHGDVGGGWHPEPEPEGHPGFFKRMWNSMASGGSHPKAESKKAGASKAEPKRVKPKRVQPKKAELAKVDQEEHPWFFKRMWNALTSANEDIPVNPDPSNDPFQLSDIALKWMVDELVDAEAETMTWETDNIPDIKPEPLSWSPARDSFLERYEDNREEALGGKMHDTMAVGGGSKLSKIMLWNFMEYLPGIWRYEYYGSESDYPWYTRLLGWIGLATQFSGAKWEKTYFPLNMGGCRDLVAGSLVHYSVLERRRGRYHYSPANEVFKGTSKGSAASKHLLSEAELHAIKTDGSAPSSPVYFREQPHLTTGSASTDMIYKLEIK